ncbi:MAG TPA: IclR family transcriptional regulator C-terminal domain-containing protein [bacterium]|nr:IclR family transcriptional regulator C-terminal domain-containing protein [bacterium]
MGRRAPAHCTALGKVLLAHADPQLQTRVLAGRLKRYTPGTIVDPPTLRRVLQAVRERGYAVDDQEFEEGIRCVAAPVLDYTGRVVAALSVSAPAGRLGPDRDRGLAEVVRAAARRASGELGHAPERAAGRGTRDEV